MILTRLLLSIEFEGMPLHASLFARIALGQSLPQVQIGRR